MVAAREARGRPDPVARRRWEGREEGRGGARPPYRIVSSCREGRRGPRSDNTRGERTRCARTRWIGDRAARGGFSNRRASPSARRAGPDSRRGAHGKGGEVPATAEFVSDGREVFRGGRLLPRLEPEFLDPIPDLVAVEAEEARRLRAIPLGAL